MSATALNRQARPYPFSSLPMVGRAQVEAGRVLRSYLPLLAGPGWAAACAALGGPVEISLVEASALPARELSSRTRGITIRLAGLHGRQALVVLDPILAPRL